MIKILLVFTCLLFGTYPVHASDPWYQPYCSSSCADTAQSVHSLTELTTLNSLHQAAQALNANTDAQIQEWGDFTRWLKGTPTKAPVTPALFQSRWRDIQDEARAILEVERLIGITKRKFDVCVRNCSAWRRVELEKELEKYERLKTHLVSLSPWWLSEDFDKVIEKSRKNPDYSPTESDLRKVFTGSMTDFFKEAFEIKKEASQIVAEIENALSPYSSSRTLGAVRTNLFLRHSDTIDLLLKRGVANGQVALCSLAESKEKWNTMKRWASNSLEIGLVTVGLLAGPPGLLSSLSVRSSVSLISRLGLSSRKVSPLLPDSLLSAKMISEAIEQSNICEQKLMLTKALNESQKEWRECLKEKEYAAITAVVGSLGPAAITILPATHKFLALRNPPASSAAQIFQKSDGTTVSVLNLSQKQSLRAQKLDNVSERYWNFVGDVYQKRLNLSDQEIKSFVQTSKLFEDRTQLVMMTRGPPQSGNIQGGVAMVTSQKAEELLPLEKATGIKLGRENGKVAEIVRLTSVSEDNPHLMQDLLKQLAAVSKADPELKKMYVYTSRVHARLYKRFGLPYKEVARPVERDVVIEIDAKAFNEAMLK